MNPYLMTDETEIDLADLFRYLLRRIVWILLIGVVGAGLAGGFKYYSMKTSSSDPKSEAEEETAYELKLAMYEQESELITTSDESTLELIRKQKEYLETSLLMQLDPYHVWKAQTLVRVTSHSEDFPAYHFEELYKFDLSNAVAFGELAEKMGTERAYLREMFGIWSTGSPIGSGDDTSNVILRDEDYEDILTSKVFYVQTMGRTRDEAMELMEVLLAELEASHQKHEKEHPHELEVYATSCVQTVDTGIRNTQKDHMAYTQALLYQMKDNVDKGALLSKPEASQPSASEGVSKKSLLKWGLVGFVAGVILVCIWFVVRYMRNDKLVDYADLERKGLLLKDLGSLSEQGVSMAAANIRNFAGDRKRLFLTGMASEAEFNQACSGLKEYLPEYELIAARDVLHDPKSRELLPGCDAAVLVEQKGVTRYSAMIEEVTFLANAEKEIVGIVIV